MGNIEVVAHRLAELSSVSTGKPYGDEAGFTGCVRPGEHIGGVAACTDGNRNVTRPAQRTDLSCEDLLETEVIGDRGQYGGICREGDCSQGPAFP